MATLEELVVRIRADSSQLQTELKRAQNVVAGSTSGMSRSFTGVGNALKGMGAEVGNLNSLIAPLVGALGVRQIAAYSDAWKGVENRLKLVTSGTEELASVSDRLFRIAHETRADLTATATLYQRLTFATKGLGITQQEVFTFAEQLNKQLAVGGLTAEEARASIFQLTQALNKGKLDGDEFRTILESMPPLLEALEKSLGKSRGEIIAMAAAGKLGPQVLVEAVNSMADVTNKRFSELSLTIGQAFTQLNNAFTRFVGQSKEVGGAAAAVANMLQFLAENIDEVGRVALALVAVVGTRLAIGFGVALAAMNPYAAALTALIGTLTYLATGHTEAEKAMIRNREIMEKLIGASGEYRKELEQQRKAELDAAMATYENAKAKLAAHEALTKRFNVGTSGTKYLQGRVADAEANLDAVIMGNPAIFTQRPQTIDPTSDEANRIRDAIIAGKQGRILAAPVEMDKKAVNKLQQAKQALEDYNRQLQRQHEYAQMSPADAAAQKVYYDTLDLAQKAGVVNAEALALANAEVARSNDLMNKKMEESARFAAELKDQFANTAADIVFGAKSAGDALRGLSEAIAKMIVQRHVLGPLSDSMFGSPGSGSSGMLGNLFSGFSSMLPSFDVGSDYVPRDMVANIHKGEMIIPAKQAEQIRSGGGGGLTVNQYNTFQSGVTRAELQQVLPQVAAAAKNAVFDEIQRGGSASKLVGVR